MKLSLVVPVKNESASIVELLASIEAQTLPPDELLVVDGGSSDGTPDLVERWASGRSGRLRVRVIRTPGAMPGEGRNIGIAAARNEWVALTDAGIRVEPDWLERMAEVTHREIEVDIVYGNYVPVVGSDFERCAVLVYVPPKSIRGCGLMRGPSIASCLLRRSAWEAVGGFPDYRAAEDLIFMERVEAAGFHIGWAPRATVHWRLQPTLGRTFRKFRLYSTHNVWAGRQYDWHYGVARTYLATLPFLPLSFLHSPWWLLGPAATAAARVARSIWRRGGDRRLFAVLSPLTFSTVGVIMLTIDLAMFVGWAEAIKRSRSTDRGLDPSVTATALRSSGHAEEHGQPHAHEGRPS